jgi:DNA-binding NarL/FixJ family response regulator
MSSAPVRVLIVDDDDLMRAGLRAVLSSDVRVEVVGEAADGRAAIEQVRALDPQLVLMDVRMPSLDGIGATRELLAVSPTVKVVILTTFEQDDYIFGALSAGASGFLLKRTDPETLLAAIQTVAAGGFAALAVGDAHGDRSHGASAGTRHPLERAPRVPDASRAGGSRARRARALER